VRQFKTRVFAALPQLDFRGGSIGTIYCRVSTHDQYCKRQERDLRALRQARDLPRDRCCPRKAPQRRSAQLDLFDEVARTERVRRIYDAVDALSEKFGKHTVYLATSLKALTTPSHSGDRNVVAVRQQDLFRGEPKRKRLAVPMLGEAS